MFNSRAYPGVPLLDAAALAAITTHVHSILNPFVERLQKALTPAILGLRESRHAGRIYLVGDKAAQKGMPVS